MLLLIFHKKVIALRLGHSTEPQSYNNCRNGQRRGKRKSGTHFTCAPLTYQLKPTMWTGNISYTTQYVLFSKPYLESYISNLCSKTVEYCFCSFFAIPSWVASICQSLTATRTSPMICSAICFGSIYSSQEASNSFKFDLLV